jgi:hypothetical protein
MEIATTDARTMIATPIFLYPLLKRSTQRFKEAGRRVKLVNIKRNLYNGTLRYLCIFQGEDAEQGYFQDDRFLGDNY